MCYLVRLCLAAVILAISACASVPMAPEQFNMAAKSFTPPPPDRAHVYVYRHESIGAAVKMDLRLDGYPAGTTVAKTFTLLPVRPGYHMLIAESENNSELQIYAQGGQMIFVWQEVKMGLLYARTKLQLVSPQEGYAGVSECNLIAFPPPPLPPALPPQPPMPMPAPTPMPGPAPTAIPPATPSS
jgi:hypothetical protein